MTASDRESGLAQERTALAWHRTLLAFAVGSLIAARVLAAALDVWAVLVALAGLVWTAALWVVVAQRHGRSRLRAGPARGGPVPRPGGLLLAATAALTTGGALLGLADVTLGVLRR